VRGVFPIPIHDSKRMRLPLFWIEDSLPMEILKKLVGIVATTDRPLSCLVYCTYFFLRTRNGYFLETMYCACVDS